MSAIPINFIIYKNTDFKVSINIRNSDNTFLDLTTYSIEAKMARNFTTTSKINLNPQTIDPISGLIQLSLQDTSTSLITGTDSLKLGRYVYDVVLTDANLLKEKVITGIIDVQPSVS